MGTSSGLKTWYLAQCRVKNQIIAVTELQIVEWHNYKHLEWITMRRDDDKLYKFIEGDFKRLRIQDIKDMLLLLNFVNSEEPNLSTRPTQVEVPKNFLKPSSGNEIPTVELLGKVQNKKTGAKGLVAVWCRGSSGIGFPLLSSKLCGIANLALQGGSGSGYRLFPLILGLVAGRGWEKTCYEDWARKCNSVYSVLKLTGDRGESFRDLARLVLGVNKDLHCVESYQKKLNLTKSDTYHTDLKRKEAYTAYSNPRGFIYQNKNKQNRLMQIDELHKFSDGTLNDVRTALDDYLKGIQMKYLPQTIWRKSDKERAATMIQAIDKQLKTRRIMRSLEKFVGGRLYKVVRHMYSNPMIQPKSEGSTQGYPLVSVEVLRYDKRSKSENMGIVPTEIKLILEHTQQGISYEVSVDPYGFAGYLKMEVKVPVSSCLKDS
nr:hypothetical protein [Tanacetum cinerariifolium]